MGVISDLLDRRIYKITLYKPLYNGEDVLFEVLQREIPKQYYEIIVPAIGRVLNNPNNIEFKESYVTYYTYNGLIKILNIIDPYLINLSDKVRLITYDKFDYEGKLVYFDSNHAIIDTKENESYGYYDNK